MCLFVVETSRLIPISMAHVETLRQTWARADQEAHASFNVQCETDLNEQAFRFAPGGTYCLKIAANVPTATRVW